jgi:MoxR-like ATPase
MEKLTEQDFTRARQDMQKLINTLANVITGQNKLIEQLVIAFFAQGHILLEGLPGLGKTHLIKALASCSGLNFSRIQCTPDLMPADITGSDLPLQSAQGEQLFKFQPGPVFSSLLLVDEINRASPKTQSALLEAMQENQVTYSGKRHALPSPFWLMATQNPIEIEGTYPLPEAQLDRFMVKLKVDFPSHDALLTLLDLSLDQEPGEQMDTLFTPQRLLQISTLCQHILVSDYIKKSAVKLLLMTQPGTAGAGRHFRYGASPRGLQSLVRLARVHALLHGRLQVDLEDLSALAVPALRHRVLLSIESELSALNADDLLEQMIFDWEKGV